MKVPNSPAAVSSMFGVSYLCHCLSEGWEGDAPGTSQKTCKTKSKNCPFEESGQCANGFKIIFNYSMSGRTKVQLVCAVFLSVSMFRLSAQEVGGDTITGKSASG